MDADQPILPDFEGGSVAAVVPVLLGRHLGSEAAWMPPVARGAQQVVLLVLDGLGWNALQEHAAIMPTLAAMDGGSITTVVPSTTSTALTSIATGLAPAQHGVVGYRMLVGGEVLNVLRWSVRDGGRPPDPFDVQRHTAFMAREVPVVTRSEFRSTGFTQAHLRGAKFVGWHTTSTLIEHCLRAVEAGQPLVYAYYPGVDTVAHEFGLHDRVYRRELAATDRLVDELRAVLPAHVVLLVTSDHGQVHLDRSAWTEIPELTSRCAAVTGDGRFRYLHAEPGKAGELLDRARESTARIAWVYSRRELLDTGMMGSGATGTIPSRIGDVILAARAPVAFVDPALPNEVRLRSGHGSLTADEMLVPLVAAAGGATG
jgi:predicted AlkP superfamily pyrophosphatase or phosphodiesterase